MKERDYLDSHREVSPLRKADDAIELDNSHLTIPEKTPGCLSNTSACSPNWARKNNNPQALYILVAHMGD